MSDIFESDIDEDENFSILEDSEQDSAADSLEFEQPLFVLKLDYSYESLYAKTEKKFDIKTGDFAIVSTRYGRDMAKVIGQTKKNCGNQSG